MALSPEDVDALGKLLDQRLEAHGKLIDQKMDERERKVRNRRRFWLWFWIALFIGSSVASWFAAQSAMQVFKDQISGMQEQVLQAKIAYQQQLAHDKQMQQERAEAVKATGYKSERKQADYEADLMRQAFQLIGKSAKTREKSQKLATGEASEEDIDASLQDISGMSEQMTKMLGQMLLHETDPAHNGRAEQLAAGDEGLAPATKEKPVDQQLQQLQAQPAPTPAPAPAP